jgi:hypothetical protein
LALEPFFPGGSSNHVIQPTLHSNNHMVNGQAECCCARWIPQLRRSDLW